MVVVSSLAQNSDSKLDLTKLISDGFLSFYQIGLGLSKTRKSLQILEWLILSRNKN